MSSSQIIGIVALVIGAVLLYFAFQGSQSAGDQIAETFTGRFSDTTMWYFIAGAAAAVGGAVMLFLRR
ncbi:MAG TPA: DUF3185 family protein [Marinobacter sp.]|nr:DUF3185 family protein [Marinobacter sp.]